MAPLISQDVDSLIGGVSQQPAENRKDSQVTEAFNCSLDPTEGLSTRNGTRLVTNNLVDNSTLPSQELFWSSVDSGPGSRFILKLAVGDSQDPPELKAINVETGEIQDVTIPAESQSYFSKPSSGANPFFATTTVGDTTFITNDTVTVEMDDIAEPVPPLQACFWFRAPLINQEGTGFDDFKFSATNREGDRTASWSLLGADFNAGPGSVSQTMAYQAMTAVTTTGYPTSGKAVGRGLAHPIGDSPQPPYGGEEVDVLGARIWNEQGGFPPDFDIDAIDGYERYKWETWPDATDTIGGAYQRGWMFYMVGWNPTRDGFEDQRPNTNAPDQNSSVFMGEYYESSDVTGKGGKLPIQNWEIADIYYQVDSGSDANAVFFNTERGPKLESLPPVAEDGMTVPIADDPESDGTYYLKFDQAQGAWVEGRKLGESIALNANTMPHVIKFDQTSKLFSVETYEWGERTVGDAGTNTPPSFVGKTINDLLLYRDRLAIASGTTITCSEVKEPGMFFRTSMVTLVDSDRIDLTVSGGSDGSGIITSLSDSALGLLITTDRSQYLMSSGDNAFTGSEVKISRLSQNPVHPRTQPLASSSRFFWTTYNGRHSNVWEYIMSNSAGNAVDVTGQCPTYIQGEVISSATDDLENRALFLNSLGEIYVFQHLMSDNQRLQSAWSKWDLQASGVEYRPRYITVIAGVVYIATGYGVLEVLAKDYVDECGWQCRIDGQTPYVGGFTYNQNTQLTSAATGFQTGTWGDNLINLKTGIIYENVNTVSTPQFKGNLQEIDGDWVWGNPIQTTVKLSPFIVKTSSGNRVKAYLGGRTQLRTLTLNCFETGPFTVWTDVDGEALSTSHQTANIEVGGSLNLQPPETIEFITDVGGRNTETNIRVEAQSSQPLTITSLRYECLYHRRGS